MTDRLPNDRRAAVMDREPAVEQRVAKRPSRTATPSVALFLLSKDGHRRLFEDDHREADEQHRRSLLYAQQVRKEVRSRPGKPRLEVFTFDSFSDLLRRRPTVRGSRWSAVILLTHGSAQIETDLVRSGIWLGDREYFASSPDADSVIYAAIERADDNTLDGFRRSFRPEAEAMIVVCGLGHTPAEVGEFMRDLFATDGAVAVPRVRVGLDKTTGKLGAMESDDDPQIRPLVRADWELVPAR